LDAPDPGRRGAVATDDAADLHARFLRTARSLRSDGDPQEVLAAVVGGLLDLDLGEAGDRVSLNLTSGAAIDVVATLPPVGLRTSSETARRAVREAQLVHLEDGDARVVAAPLIVEGTCRGALVVRRARGCPVPDAAVELAAVLLAGATSTVQWLEGQRQLDVARADFVARVSHELRTPLAIISGFASTLGTQGEDLSEDERHAMLDRIVTAAVRLEHLIEELLTLASVELGHRGPEPVECAVRDVLDLVVRDQGGAGRTRVDCPPDLRVVTDPAMARLVIGPVVENALEHGEHVELEATRTARGVEVVVHDDGPGIAEDLGDRIFDRFVRGDDPRPGLGLGLATAAQIGAAIGARLSVEDSVAGARLRIDLPDLPDVPSVVP
jgi:signal transduction histidine kinase